MMNPSGIESNKPDQPELSPHEKIAESFFCRQQHLCLIQVIMRDCTDGFQELVQTNEWLLHPSEKNLLLRGNLFILEDMTDHSGRILLRRAPLPHARHKQIPGDLSVSPRREGGFDFFLLDDDQETLGGWVILDYTGGMPGRTHVLHKWQQDQRPGTAGHVSPRFISNTWGDRSQDGRMNEEFIFRELAAAADLGVEVLQLDDGWQKGITSNSVLASESTGLWEGFWNGDPHFWDPHPQRFPRGLEPILKEADRLNIKIGLWYAPDSWNELANWQKDGNRILELHRTCAVDHFKLDSIKIPTLQGRKNFEKFLEMVERESGGSVVFDLDITAGVRPGFWGAPSAGPLFVENRYTDWHNYWPHQTLRNLWSLSRWVDPRRLRMEFLNNQRNQSLYDGDPLAPEHYRSDTLFAMVMMANPLGWFEVSGLSEEFRDAAAPLIKLWKEHKSALFEGTIIPVGSKPDGWQPTGFLSLAPQNKSGYLLVFRELCGQADFTLELPVPMEVSEILYSRGEASLTFTGNRACVKISEKAGFLLARISRE